MSGKEPIRYLDSSDNALLDSFIKFLEGNLKKKYGEEFNIRVELEAPGECIPLSIYTRSLGALESTVKYMRENLKLKPKDIARILGKSPNNIAVSYSKSKVKHPSMFSKLDFSNKVPLTIFTKDRTVLESIVGYLRDKGGMSYHDIGALIGRDERTVWTVHNRRGDSR